jgi:hypothetical protein
VSRRVARRVTLLSADFWAARTADGEFGPVYADKTDGPDFEKINEVRFKVLEDQLQLYDETASSWSIWLWKDIGFQGMIYVDENTPYMKLMKPFLEKKKVGGTVTASRLKSWLTHSTRTASNSPSMLGVVTIRPFEICLRRLPSGLERLPLRSKTVTQRLGTSSVSSLVSCEKF